MNQFSSTQLIWIFRIFTFKWSEYSEYSDLKKFTQRNKKRTVCSQYSQNHRNPTARTPDRGPTINCYGEMSHPSKPGTLIVQRPSPTPPRNVKGQFLQNPWNQRTARFWIIKQLLIDRGKWIISENGGRSYLTVSSKSSKL